MEGQGGDQDPAEAAAGGGVLLAEDHRDSEKDGLMHESSTLPRHCNFLGVQVLEKNSIRRESYPGKRFVYCISWNETDGPNQTAGTRAYFWSQSFQYFST